MDSFAMGVGSTLSEAFIELIQLIKESGDSAKDFQLFHNDSTNKYYLRYSKGGSKKNALIEYDNSRGFCNFFQSTISLRVLLPLL